MVTIGIVPLIHLTMITEAVRLIKINIIILIINSTIMISIFLNMI